jgi:N-acetylneuraminic acid mutarotase
MHTATALLPSWLKQRNPDSYWHSFHKWKFNDTDPISAKKIGIYIFGGVNNKEEASNQLWRISISPKSDQRLINALVDTELLSPNGHEPPARCGHSACLHGSYIAVFGGKNLKENGGNPYQAFNDLYIYNIISNTWMPVVLYGFSPAPNYGGFMCLLKGKIIAFGGVNAFRYCSMQPKLLELGMIFDQTQQKR